MRSLSKSWHVAAALVGIFALAGCASADYHYSQLSGKRYYRAPIDTYEVIIIRVDGKDTLQRPVLVDPGLRVRRVGEIIRELADALVEVGAQFMVGVGCHIGQQPLNAVEELGEHPVVDRVGHPPRRLLGQAVAKLELIGFE